MSLKSKIEWTESTWNPVTGCTKISPGCKNCYAETFAERFRGVKNHPYEQGFDLKLWRERIDLPLNWKEPQMIFVNSMSDLFHEKVPDEFITKVFQTMIKAEHHIFQMLTKRSKRMKNWTKKHFLSGEDKILLPKNIWLGVSIENQNYIDRIYDLQQTPAVTRFISFEPLLGTVKLNKALLKNIHWVIVGGESGIKARPMTPTYAKDICNQCKINNVPFFFKQWGTYNAEGKRVGRKKSGRKLEGKVYDEMPDIKTEQKLVLA